MAAGDEIQAATKRLDFLALSGRPGRVPGTRELSVPRPPFILVYRVDGTDISIVRLLHERQRWPARR
ncbi:type II toxin-antitoxin system RelE/ParE family toxin [Aurantimonas sp. VKM B-3413]|nr:type II toxin-antitoxin system RelE/ParE family toxin [Aurantimonas sp. VKM B-3413]